MKLSGYRSLQTINHYPLVTTEFQCFSVSASARQLLIKKLHRGFTEFQTLQIIP